MDYNEMTLEAFIKIAYERDFLIDPMLLDYHHRRYLDIVQKILDLLPATNSALAESLGFSVDTVRTYVRILLKMNVIEKISDKGEYRFYRR